MLFIRISSPSPSARRLSAAVVRLARPAAASLAFLDDGDCDSGMDEQKDE